MSDTTTIQITTEQRGDLDELKTHEKEAYKSVLQRLIDSYNGAIEEPEESTEGIENSLQNMRDEIMASVSAECGDVATTEDIRELVNRLDDLQSQLPTDVAGELQR